MAVENLYNTQAAADFLQNQIPEKEGYWLNFLRNNRRTDRLPDYRIKVDKLGGGWVYHQQALADFLEYETRQRYNRREKLSPRVAEAMQAFGIGEKGGGAFGRKLEWTVTAQYNEGAGGNSFFTQLIISNPLLVFKLTPEETESLGRELVEIAAKFKQWGGSDGIS